MKNNDYKKVYCKTCNWSGCLCELIEKDQTNYYDYIKKTIYLCPKCFKIICIG